MYDLYCTLTDIIYRLILIICCSCRRPHRPALNILKDLTDVNPAVVYTLCTAKTRL